MNPQTRFECLRAVLGEATFDDSRWPEAARLIEDVCGTKGSTLVFGQRYPDDSTQVFLARFFHRGERRQDWEGEYYRVYHPVDERAPRIGRAPAGRIFHVSELYTEAERKTSPTYNEAMLHGQNQNGLNVRLDGPGGSNIIWAFADPTARRGWESGQIERVESLLPHLRQHVLMRAALADAGVLGATLESLLDTGRLAVIQLDHRKTDRRNERPCQTDASRTGRHRRPRRFPAGGGARRQRPAARAAGPGAARRQRTGTKRLDDPAPSVSAPQAHPPRDAGHQSGNGLPLAARGGAGAGRRPHGPPPHRPRSRTKRSRPLLPRKPKSPSCWRKGAPSARLPT